MLFIFDFTPQLAFWPGLQHEGACPAVLLDRKLSVSAA